MNWKNNKMDFGISLRNYAIKTHIKAAAYYDEFFA